MNDDLATFWQSAYWWTQNLFRNFLPHVLKKKLKSKSLYFQFHNAFFDFLEPIAKDNISALLRVALFKKKKQSMDLYAFTDRDLSWWDRCTTMKQSYLPLHQSPTLTQWVEEIHSTTDSPGSGWLGGKQCQYELVERTGLEC